MKAHIQQLKHLLAIALLAGSGLILLSLRMSVTGTHFFRFLLWNLLLAVLPLLPGYLFLRFSKHGIQLSTMTSFFAWLFFFPNAPYLITDFAHVHDRPDVPMWFDASLIFCFTMAGLWAGIISLHWIHKGLNQCVPKLISWILVGLSIAASGYGIYLGRVLRLNSWEVLTNTQKVIRLSIQHLSSPQAWAMTITFSIVVTVLYAIFKLSYPSPKVNAHEKTYLL